MTRLLFALSFAPLGLLLACSEDKAGPDGTVAIGGAGGGGSTAGTSSGSTSGAGGSVAAGGSQSSLGGAPATEPADAGAPLTDEVVVPPHHLGKPFRIVNGVISADSNEYGLEAHLYVTHGAEESDVSFTSTTGRICVNGETQRAVEGDFGGYWGFDLGFSVGPTAFRTLTANLLSISPQAPAWDLQGRVLGIAAKVTGQTPVALVQYASPGGLDPAGQFETIIDLTLYSHCGFGPVTSSGQVIQSLFSDLYNVWCIPEYRQRWSADSVSAFFWSHGGVVVATDAGLDGTRDPYDFCLEEIRPIVLGAGPDEPGDPVSDAGSADAGGADAAP